MREFVGNSANEGTTEDASNEEKLAVAAGVMFVENLSVMCEHYHCTGDLERLLAFRRHPRCTSDVPW